MKVKEDSEKVGDEDFRVGTWGVREEILRVMKIYQTFKQLKQFRDFPGGLTAKSPHSQCRGPGFHPWSGN